MWLCYHSLTHLHRADSRDRFSHRGGEGREKHIPRNHTSPRMHLARPEPLRLVMRSFSISRSAVWLGCRRGQTLAEMCMLSRNKGERGKSETRRLSPAQNNRLIEGLSFALVCRHARHNVESLLKCARVRFS